MNQESMLMQRPAPDSTPHSIIHEWLPGVIDQIKGSMPFMLKLKPLIM